MGSNFSYVYTSGIQYLKQTEMHYENRTRLWGNVQKLSKCIQENVRRVLFYATRIKYY